MSSATLRPKSVAESEKLCLSCDCGQKQRDRVKMTSKRAALSSTAETDLSDEYFFGDDLQERDIRLRPESVEVSNANDVVAHLQVPVVHRPARALQGVLN